MAAPLIGMTTYRQRAQWGVWDQPADLLHASYADSIRAAGGVPVLLPPRAGDAAAEAALLVDRLDGLVLTGGSDVDPARYGAATHATTDAPHGTRDGWESALAAAALERDQALLGICRGMQVLNVLRGGSLVQHLPDEVGHDGHRPAIGVPGRHVVRFADGSRIRGLMGERAEVATHHHQAIAQVGRGLVPTGWAEDGTVEALELPDARWAMAVQWHPEIDRAGDLLTGFVRACAVRV